MAKTPINVDMSGKTALVTGATGGIGKEIARGLARMRANVIIGARSRERAEAARAEITQETGNPNVSYRLVDVADLSSVRRFAEGVVRDNARIDVLVNNAGAWFTERKETPDGHELTFATNVLGPYLLTSLLLDPLRRAPAGRVVNIVSGLTGSYDAGDLEFRSRKFDGFKAYAQSKTALRMQTWSLAARLAGSSVTANGAAPGFVRTEFNRNASGFVAGMINFSARLFAVTPAEGADTPLWVAVAPELAGVSGNYFDGRAEKPRKFDEPAALADLEARCAEMTSVSGKGRAARPVVTSAPAN